MSDRTRLQTHVDVIDLWETISALAADLGMKRGTVRVWRQNSRIPRHRYDLVVEAAQRRGLEGVTRAFLRETRDICPRRILPRRRWRRRPSTTMETDE